MRDITITDQMIVSTNSIERDNDAIQAWRIPYQRKELYYPLLHLGTCPAGVRLQLQTDSPTLEIHVVPMDAHRAFDLCINNKLIESQIIEPDQASVRFEQIDAADGEIDIWLCQHTPVQLTHLRIDDDKTCSAREDKRIKWLTYGSSITQCSAAHSPARTWPATAARKLDLNLHCLGFSGNCHLEGMVAKQIRDTEADLISLKLGINVQGGGTLSDRTYQSAVINLIDTIREKHTTTPIAVITSICSPPREDGKNRVDMSLNDYRRETREAVDRIQQYNDAPLELFEGLDVFGPELIEYLPDELHPNGDGYEVLGNNIADKVIKPMIDKYLS